MHLHISDFVSAFQHFLSVMPVATAQLNSGCSAVMFCLSPINFRDIIGKWWPCKTAKTTYWVEESDFLETKPCCKADVIKRTDL